MSLAVYQFLPWLREGLGNAVTEKDTLDQGGATGARALLTLQVDINGQAAGTKEFRMLNAADVIGFSRDLVIRTEPVNSSTTFSSNLLAHVEFYDEDFPWRYSPVKADGDKLRPWICLVVLKANEFTRKETVIPLAQIELTDSTLLPDHKETWLWAHVQKIEDSTIASDNNISDRLISRLLCPRKLDPNTAYHAFVIPVFESGRLAGLGKTEEEINNGNIHLQDPSWGMTPSQNLFPIYYEWSFRTADQMDFEYLASLLEARDVDPLVGKKPIDCRKPGFGLPDYAKEFTVYLEGALKAPSSPGSAVISADSADSLLDFETKIKGLLDLNYADAGDPSVTPPFYGQQHIFEQTLSLSRQTWIHQLNRSPAFRAASGLGAKVFRKYQDRYLQKAWEQLESILEANKIIDTAKTTLALTQLLYDKNINSLQAEELISFTGPVHVKIQTRDTNGQMSSLNESFRHSCFNGSVYTLGFRRLASRRGPFRRKLEMNGSLLDLEVLKKLIALRRKKPHVLEDSRKYTLYVIERPDFIYQFRNNFDDNILSVNETALAQAFNAFAGIISKPAGKDLCDYDIPHNLAGMINPAFTITSLLQKTLNMSDNNWFSDPLNIKPALAYPDFEDPMYEKLKELSVEWLAPNLQLIPNNTITLLEPNRKFIESFMTGLNVAMNREMRWREYPTDERASCFRQFWDTRGIKNTNSGTAPGLISEQYKDISPIHTWKNWSGDPAKAALDEFGSHQTRMKLSEEEQLVLVIKGDLLKCFPNTTIYAAEALVETYSENGQQLKRMRIDPNGVIEFPAFKAEAADLKFIGFNLTVAEVRGDDNHPGWFFIVQETPGETRFGLDSQVPAASASSWDDASWSFVNGNYISGDDNFSPITNNMTTEEAARWKRSSADMASILYQKPVMIAIHANEMLTGL